MRCRKDRILRWSGHWHRALCAGDLPVLIATIPIVISCYLLSGTNRCGVIVNIVRLLGFVEAVTLHSWFHWSVSALLYSTTESHAIAEWNSRLWSYRELELVSLWRFLRNRINRRLLLHWRHGHRSLFTLIFFHRWNVFFSKKVLTLDGLK